MPDAEREREKLEEMLGSYEESQGYKVEDLKQKISDIKLESANHRDIINLGKDVNNRYNITEIIGNKEKLKKAFGNIREMDGKISKEDFAKGANKVVKQRLEEAFSNYPADWARIPSKMNRKLYVRKSQRGFSQKMWSSQMVITIPNFQTFGKAI